MAASSGPDIADTGLVLALDAADQNNYNLTAVEVLVVAGGGGGGGRHGGGGGGGGVIYNQNFAVTPGSALTVTVGNGGSASTYGGRGGNGGNSVFGSLTAIGGGGGGGYDNGNPTVNGATGGSGGGGAAAAGLPGGNGTGASGTSGQGNAGATPASFSDWAAGGGGGAGENGYAPSGFIGGNGGNGLGFNISGTFTYYGGGGGGGGGGNIDSNGGLGGLGGGGRATGAYNPTQGVAGQANTGGGGGASRDQAGAAGGSGIVIVRYAGPQKAIGGTITSVGGYTIHTFTSVGSTTFTPLIATNNSAISGLSDFSGGGNFATSVNGPTYSSANGGSIVFDGVDDYIELNTNNIISGTNPFTFEAFYKVTNASVNAEIFGNYGTGYTSNTIWISGRYGVYINTSVPYFQGYPLGAGTYHMAFTRTSAGACTLYKNGVVDGTATSTASISSSQNFRIGSDVNGIGEVFGGNLYSLKVYNRALTAAEIQQNFNATRRRFGI